MRKLPRALLALDILSLLGIVIATVMVFAYAPMERVMGMVQKVFYFHVASAWVGMLSFFIAFLSGIAYLISRRDSWDLLGEAAVELGLVFSLIGVVTGSIWARPIWNTWWTWDPRLTTVTIMELVYIAYLMLRGAIDEPGRRMRFSAIYAVIGFLSVPLTFFSIRIYRTIHPVVVGSGDPNSTGGFSMTPAMSQTFFVSLIVFTVFYACLLWHRARLGRLAREVEERRTLLDQ